MTCIINCPPRWCHVITLVSMPYHFKLGGQNSRKIKIVRPKIGFQIKAVKTAF